MATFTDQNIIDYYDLTEGQMRMLWKLNQAMGLHYGIWDKNTKSLADAIINNNRVMAKLAGIQKGDKVLDAGCGVGGSSIYLAKNIGAQCTGITLSERQVKSANSYAQKNGVSDKVHFEVNDYFDTKYEEASFDFAWALESMATARDKGLFLKEMYRVLKPGGRIVICDLYKPHAYNVDDHKCMQDMLYHWMISDILTVDEKRELANEIGFNVVVEKNFTQGVKKTVNRIYWLNHLGMMGTKLYKLFYPKATAISQNHYKTGYGQYYGYKKGLWNYYIWVLEKPKLS